MRLAVQPEGSKTMQITFDTAVDSLDDVLGLLSKAYDVEVTVQSPSANDSRPRTKTRAATSPGTAARRASTRSAKPGRATKSAKAPGKAAARRPARRGSGSNVSPAGQSALIRAWAKRRGLAVGDAGRLSASVIAGYQATHSRGATKPK